MEEAFSHLAVSQQHLDMVPCANTKQVNESMVNCDNRGSLICSKCHLVQVLRFPDLQLLIKEHEDHDANHDLSIAATVASLHIGLHTNWIAVLI